MTTFVLDARTATPHFPGIGRYVTNLARVMPPLLQEGERLQLLRVGSSAEQWPALELRERVAALQVDDSTFSLSQQWRVPSLLKRMDRPIYHSTYYLMPYRPAVPSVLTVYDLIALLHPQAVSLRARLLFRITTRLALRAVDRVITISEASRRDLLNHFAIEPEKVVSIPLAPDPVFVPQPPDRVAAMRARYELPDAYLLYLGINKPHKNLVRLVEAYAALDISTVPPLIIAGAWDERYPHVRRVVLHRGLGERVRFLGRIEEADLPALYSGATLFLFPSLYEGFGLPPLEAMACGAPLVCSNRSSLPEVAQEAALLFDPERVEAITAALRRALGDPELRRSMVRRSLEVAARFSWRRTADETLAVYRALARTQ